MKFNGPWIGDAVTTGQHGEALVRARWKGDGWTGATMPSADALWNSGSFAVAREQESDTLLHLSVAHADVQHLGVGPQGIERRRIPYSHIAFVAPGFPRLDGLEAELERKMRATWGEAYIDPVKGCRVGFFKCDRVVEPAALWGRGIFVPDHRENPVGSVAIRLWDGARSQWGESRQLCIGTGSVPAGLYKGQSALIFSGDPGLTLACDVRLRAERSPLVFYLHSSLAERNDRNTVHLTIPALAAAKSELGTRISIKRVTETEHDAEFEVHGEKGFAFRLSTDFDTSTTGFRSVKPAKGFSIVGAAMPVQSVHRWWINLDDRGQLVSSAMTPAASALVIESKTLRRFDWRDGRWLADAPAGLSVAELGGMDWQLLLFTKPLGYLSGLPERSPNAFRSPEEQSGPSLDWLDFAGAAELGFRRRTRGLAETQNDEAFAARMSNVSSSDRQAWQNIGDFLLVGPLLLKAF